MIVIFTGSNEIDQILEEELRGSMVVSYADFIIEDNKFENQTVILGADAIKDNLQEYLYLLRSMNIRVILLLKNEKSSEVKIALENGIYDLVFGNFYPSQIKKMIEKPQNFSDIAKLYRKVFNIKLKERKRFRDSKKNTILE